MSEMATILDTIYLQADDEGEFTDESTWCTDRIDDSDIKYTRHSEAHAEIKRLRAVLVTIEQTNDVCPACWRVVHVRGHTVSCPLTAALKENGP